MNSKLQKIIKDAIDIHVHIGPEIIPRKYSVESLIDSEHGKIAGMVLKNHFYPTTPFIKELTDKKGLKLFGGIVLNNAVGGINDDAIYAANLVSDLPILVWFPTINAKNFLEQSIYEIAPEWVGQQNFQARKAEEVKAVDIDKNLNNVLRTIKKVKGVLATGHISWQESELLVEKAKKIGINSIVITHPIYQRINMPIKTQKKMAKLGCFLEQSYSMYSIDKIPIQKIAKQIKAVGTQSVILSSDVGQPFSLSPSEALYKFSLLLLKEGITESELNQMLVDNPRKLLSVK